MNRNDNELFNDFSPRSDLESAASYRNDFNLEIFMIEKREKKMTTAKVWEEYRKS